MGQNSLRSLFCHAKSHLLIVSSPTHLHCFVSLYRSVSSSKHAVVGGIVEKAGAMVGAMSIHASSTKGTIGVSLVGDSLLNDTVGSPVSDIVVGCVLGLSLGDFVGCILGPSLGAMLGSVEGDTVGDSLGYVLGDDAVGPSLELIIVGRVLVVVNAIDASSTTGTATPDVPAPDFSSEGDDDTTPIASATITVGFVGIFFRTIGIFSFFSFHGFSSFLEFAFVSG